MENEQIIHGTPEQQLEFVIAFHKAQSEFPIIPKNSKAKIDTKAGKSYTYNYANLGDIDKVIKPILHKNGFFILQPPSTEAGRLQVKTRIVHIKGGWMEGCIDVNMPSDLKEIGTDITYLRRYSMAGLGIVTDEDVDAPQSKHSVSHKAADSPSTQQPAQPQTKGITTDQMKKMQALFNEIGIADKLNKEEAAFVKREWIANALGINVESARDLTAKEAHDVIEALEELAADRNPAPETTQEAF